MNRIILMATLLAARPICAGEASKFSDVVDTSSWGNPALLAIVSKQDGRLGNPLIFTASRNLDGTTPWRLDVSDKRPLWDYSKKIRTPPWSEKIAGSYVFVVLPCHEDQKPITREGPSYLFRIEEDSGEKPGYYTDVYRAQYQFGQGSEFLFLNIKNSKDDCGVEAYRALEIEGEGQLVRLPNEKVDFGKVFMCESSGIYC